MRKWLVIIWIALLLAACGPARPPAAADRVAAVAPSARADAPEPAEATLRPTAAPTMSPAAPARLESDALGWLASSPCAPPCWEGVTPGTTPIEQALAIWGASPAIEPGSFDTSDKDFVTWRLAESPVSGYAAIKRRGLARVVASMTIGIDYESHQHARWTLDDAMAAFGEPGYVRALAFHGMHGEGVFYDYEVKYPAYGLTLGTAFMPHTLPVLDGALRIDRVEFRPPFGAGPLDVAWEGERGFNFYCRSDPADPLQDVCDR